MDATFRRMLFAPDSLLRDIDETRSIQGLCRGMEPRDVSVARTDEAESVYNVAHYPRLRQYVGVKHTARRTPDRVADEQM